MLLRPANNRKLAQRQRSIDPNQNGPRRASLWFCEWFLGEFHSLQLERLVKRQPKIKYSIFAVGTPTPRTCSWNTTLICGASALAQKAFAVPAGPRIPRLDAAATERGSIDTKENELGNVERPTRA